MRSRNQSMPTQRVSILWKPRATSKDLATSPQNQVSEQATITTAALNSFKIGNNDIHCPPPPPQPTNNSPSLLRPNNHEVAKPTTLPFPKGRITFTNNRFAIRDFYGKKVVPGSVGKGLVGSEVEGRICFLCQIDVRFSPCLRYTHT